MQLNKMMENVKAEGRFETPKFRGLCIKNVRVGLLIKNLIITYNER